MLKSPNKPSSSVELVLTTVSWVPWKSQLYNFAESNGGDKGYELTRDCKTTIPLAPFPTRPTKDSCEPDGSLRYQRAHPSPAERTAITATHTACAAYDTALAEHIDDSTNPPPLGPRPTYDHSSRELTDRGYKDLCAHQKVYDDALAAARVNNKLLLGRIIDTLAPSTLISVKSHPRYINEYLTRPHDAHDTASLLFQILKAQLQSTTGPQKISNAKALFSATQGAATLDEHFETLSTLHATFADDFESKDPAHKGYVQLERLKCFTLLSSLDTIQNQRPIEHAHINNPSGDFRDYSALSTTFREYSQAFPPAPSPALKGGAPQSYLSRGPPNPRPDNPHKQGLRPNFPTTRDTTKPSPTHPPNSHCPHCYPLTKRFLYHSLSDCGTYRRAMASAPAPGPGALRTPRPPHAPSHLALLAAEFDSLPPGNHKDGIMSLMAAHMIATTEPPPPNPYSAFGLPHAPTPPPGLAAPAPSAQNTQPN